MFYVLSVTGLIMFVMAPIFGLWGARVWMVYRAHARYPMGITMRNFLSAVRFYYSAEGDRLRGYSR